MSAIDQQFYSDSFGLDGAIERNIDLGKLVRPIEVDQEIVQLQENGFDISVMYTPDETVDRDPALLVSVNSWLNERQYQFDAREAELVSRGLHGKSLHQALETARNEILYEEVDGWPWHEQKGCATALLTIQEAGKGYPTMSAYVGKEVFDTIFPDGEDLWDKLVQMGVDFYGKSEEDAAIFARKRLEKLSEFIDTPITPGFDAITRFCTDSLGIRSRKEVMKKVVDKHLEEERYGDRESIKMVSLGCGTALPIFEAAILAKQEGKNPQIVLIDQDPVALAYALNIAKRFGLEESVTINCERLFDSDFKPLDISKALGGEKADIIEDSGLREYLPDFLYVALTDECWKNVVDGGLMISGNMNVTRPQADFLHGLMGWKPNVTMRKIQDGISLHQQAGVSNEALKMHVTRDGVYTIYVATK